MAKSKRKAENKMETEGKKKFNIFKLILKILYDILIIFCVILIAIIFMQKVTNSNGSIAGYRIFRVVTGSMVPKYDIGEVVVCKETAIEDIDIGESIVYRGKTGQFAGKAIMHEVIGKDYKDDQTITFHVKGIANEEEDPEVTENQIYGVVKFGSPILTLLYELATSIYSSFIIVTILVINVFVSFKKGNRREEVKNIKTDLEIEDVKQENEYEEDEEEEEMEDTSSDK